MSLQRLCAQRPARACAPVSLVRPPCCIVRPFAKQFIVIYDEKSRCVRKFPVLGPHVAGHRMKLVSNSSPSETPTTTSTQGSSAEQRVCLSLPATELMRSLQLEVLGQGQGQAVVVVGVLEGSMADKAGILPGQKIMAMSDPIRYGEMWQMGDRPSLRFVRDTLRMMRNKVVDVEFSAAPIITSRSDPLPQQDINPLMSSATMGSISDTEEGGPTIGDALAQRARDTQRAQAEMTAVSKRIARRAAYMDEVSQRNDSGLFATLFAFFVGPALVILGVAYATGYLDALYTSSLTLR